MEQVEHFGIVVAHGSRSVIAQVLIQLSQCVREVAVATPVHDIETLPRMQVEESQTVFGLGKIRDPSGTYGSKRQDRKTQ